MSKNFELMQRIGRERELAFSATPSKASPQISPLEELTTDDPIMPAVDPSGCLGQQSRNEVLRLVHRLFLGPSELNLAVMFTELESSDGVAQIAAATAELLAQHSEAKVCVVDTNFRSPGLHDQFAIPNERGWINALNNGGPVRRYARRLRENLWVATAGRVGGAMQGIPTFDLYSAKPKLVELRASFDCLLFVGGNPARYPESLLWAKLVDGVVIVVEANTTRRDAGEQCRRTLRSARIPLLGAVLNNRDFPIPRPIYDRL